MAVSNVCSQCSGPMTEEDFQSNFTIHATDGLKHLKCPSTIQHAFPTFWSEKYVSKQSQYSHQSSGSCTINALETALRLQSGEKPSVTLINNVLAMASLYTSSMHTGVADVLPHVTRYKTILKSIDWMQCNVKNIKAIIERLDKNVSNSKHDVSCVITKPPETIFLHKIYKNNQYILYDSHPRHEKGLTGSHILVFVDSMLLIEYLLILFPFVNLGGGYGLYGDMMNQCEATYLQIDYNKSKNIDIMKIDHAEMSKDLSKIGFKLQKQYENVKVGSSSNLMDKIKTKLKNTIKKKDKSEYKGKYNDIAMGDKNKNDNVMGDKNKNDNGMDGNNKMEVEEKENKNDVKDVQNKNVSQENDSVMKENANDNGKSEEMKGDKTDTDEIGSMEDLNRKQTEEFEMVNKDEILDDNNDGVGKKDTNNDIDDTQSFKSEEFIKVEKSDDSISNIKHSPDNNDSLKE